MPLETTLSITDSGSASFTGITYTTPGDYEYKIYQTKGSMDRLTYDTSVYTVTVRVTNLEEAYGLQAMIWAIKDDSDSKTNSVIFTNTFSAIPVETETEEPVEEDPGEPEEETPADPYTTASVQTGDTANIALYVVMMAAAAAVIIFLVVYSKRRKTE